MTNFEELGLNEQLLKAITDMGYEKPSEVQEKAIPLLLEAEIDLVALAQTGTGKTAAFGFPLIQKIDADSRTTQGLILSPTRELCLQITNDIKKYAKHVKGLNVAAIYGGASITDQAREVKRGAQIIVATPGRMKDMISRNLVNISKIQYCILDEADEMLNMGFFEDITAILSHTPDEKNTWLFSATMPREVSNIAKKFMSDPTEITVGTKNSGSDTIQHEYYVVSGRDRYLGLKRLADSNPNIFSVIFTRTKRDAQRVAEKLIEDGYSAGALHGDLSQNQRDLVMKSFRNKQIQMLVATDVAARGIDVSDITHVINYQLPDEVETYTHRSGRTGRAGKSGVSMVIVTKGELRKIKSIERIVKKKFIEKKIPTGMEICEIQLYHLASKIKETEVSEEINDYLPAIYDVLGGLEKEELIKKMVAVEFNRFHNYYKKSQDLNTPSNSREEAGEGTTRYFINVGEKDDYDWMTLKDFLRENVGLDKDDVFRVDVKESFSFFNTNSEHSEKILGIFEDFKLDGRFINVEISKNTGRGDRGGRSGGGGGRRDRNRGGGGGGFRGRSGGDRDRRSGSGDRDRKPRDRSNSSEGGYKKNKRRY